MIARLVDFSEIVGMRDIYRHEMNCQIIHDSIHERSGWSMEYLLTDGANTVGYGSVAVAGPWKEKLTIYEYFVLPQFRGAMFDLFEELLKDCGANWIETQSNDVLLTTMLHTYAPTVASESILFHDRLTTTHQVADAVFRKAAPEDLPQIQKYDLDQDAEWIVSIKDTVAAAGDILFHYNRPYGDIYMKVAEPFRRIGVGSFLVQELKQVCYQSGNVPAARCNPSNIASRKTLQRAGFVPCGHILVGKIP
jgi:GNAT superfamily N-acetyltransferase